MGLFGFGKHQKWSEISAEQFVITEGAKFMRDYRLAAAIIGGRFLRRKLKEDIARDTARKVWLEDKVSQFLANRSRNQLIESGVCPNNPVVVLEELTEEVWCLGSAVEPLNEAGAGNTFEGVSSSLQTEVLQISELGSRSLLNLFVPLGEEEPDESIFLQSPKVVELVSGPKKPDKLIIIEG